MRFFRAQYGTGCCELCGEQVQVDEEIAYDENGDLVHVDCYQVFVLKSTDQPHEFHFGS